MSLSRSPTAEARLGPEHLACGLSGLCVNRLVLIS